MNLVYNIFFIITAIVFITTAIITIIYDYKIQRIPLVVILLNYISICLLVNPYLLVGILLILIIKKLDKSVDIVYILTLAYLFLNQNNLIYLLCIIPILIQTILSKSKKISLMISIELSFIIFEILYFLIKVAY